MEKYVCTLSTDNYLEGVLVLNENLKALKSKYPLLCLINENKIITNNIHDKIFKKEILLKYNNIEIIKNKSNKIGILKATNM